MTGPRLTPLAASLPATVPFVGPEAQERVRGRPFAARLGANESIFGPSPRAIEAMAQAARGAWMYGDPENHDLKHALARHHGVPVEAVAVGEGIDGLLGLTVRLLIGEGDTVVTSDGAYPTFNFHVAGFGGTLHKVPFRDDAEDPDALVARARETGAKLIYLSNPDNPMGSHHDAARIGQMIDALPDGCLLALDEAYIELAPASAAPAFDPTDPRVLRYRTFSKAYGLAGIRIGYAIGHPDMIASFDRVRNHYGISRISQAGALAALEDQDWLEEIRARTAEARDTIAQIARDNGLVPLPSVTNFVAIDCGKDSTFAKSVLQELLDRDIFARMPFAEPGNRCIRISCGPPADLHLFATALPEALAAAR